MTKSPSDLSKVGDKPKGDEGTNQRAIPPTMRKCEFCGKEFNSGKAFGGHKRFHLQAQRKLLEKATTNNKMSSLMPNEKLKLCCYLCNKDFPSNKSLFGHMRSHPNRKWKGVLPPTIPSEDHKQSSRVVGAARYLSKGWKKTQKRGWNCVPDAEVVAAAETLVALSRDCWSSVEFPELTQDHENLKTCDFDMNDELPYMQHGENDQP